MQLLVVSPGLGIKIFPYTSDILLSIAAINLPAKQQNHCHEYYFRRYRPGRIGGDRSAH